MKWRLTALASDSAVRLCRAIYQARCRIHCSFLGFVFSTTNALSIVVASPRSFLRDSVAFLHRFLVAHWHFLYSGSDYSAVPDWFQRQGESCRFTGQGEFEP